MRATIASSSRRTGCALLGAAAMLFTPAAPLAQEKFPAQPIEIVVPFGAGGGADALARKIAQLLEPSIGAPLFVTNIPGASGNAGLTKLLNNPPDGSTMAVLISVTVSAWASGIGYAKPDDFDVLAMAQQSASMLFVPADSPFKTFRALLDYAKSSPGGIKVATSGYGSNDDITLKYFGALGYRMINVPYAKPEQRYAASFGRRTHALYEEPGDVAALLASKRLRPLVVFDTGRHAAFDDVPSSGELGFEINDLPSFRTFVIRTGTPADRRRALINAIAKALETPQWKKFCAETQSCTRAYTPEQATQRVRNFFETSQKYLKRPPASRP
jgi:tripartite-type tricarboxylate transporter receptor subunit TctC